MINKTLKHRWSYEEDKCACDLFINYCIVNKSDYNFDNIYKIFNQLYPDIKSSSFIMKIQNIVQICIEKNILSNNECPISPLRNYSNQSLMAFEKSFSENENKLNNTIDNKNYTKIYTIIVCDMFGEETIKVYVSEIDKELNALKILPSTKLALALLDKKIEDVFNIADTKYIIQKIEEIEV